MKHHPSLSVGGLKKRRMDEVALMIASEFSRTASMSHRLPNAQQAYERARELMGVFETLELPEAVAVPLSFLYRRCPEQSLSQWPPEKIRLFSEELPEQFIHASEALKGYPHA